MSIPLDRLYHYLEGLCNDDILIYRWFPHGSKKLTDLSILHESELKDVIAGANTPSIIFHDQEPLDYYYWDHDEFVSVIKKFTKDINLNFPNEVISKFANGHLRIMTFPLCSTFEYTLLCHSEKNSSQVELYEKNGFIGVYYWSHALIARDWFRFAEHDNDLTIDCKNFQYDFLVYNRAWSGSREYRLKFTELVVNNQLVEHCNMKFNPCDGDQHYTDFEFKNKNLQITRYDLELEFEQNTASSSSSADYDSVDYKTSAVEIVLETVFDDTKHHLTEKALRPIACGKPFVLVSTPGSLAYLRSYGFRTFDGIIDETYDTIVDPVDRLNAIQLELKRISLLSVDEKYVIWDKLHQIAKFNKQRFFSTDFHQQVTKEFVTNLNSALDKCKSNRTDKFIKLGLKYNHLEHYKILLDQFKHQCH